MAYNQPIANSVDIAGPWLTLYAVYVTNELDVSSYLMHVLQRQESHKIVMIYISTEGREQFVESVVAAVCIVCAVLY